MFFCVQRRSSVRVLGCLPEMNQKRCQIDSDGGRRDVVVSQICRYGRASGKCSSRGGPIAGLGLIGRRWSCIEKARLGKLRVEIEGFIRDESWEVRVQIRVLERCGWNESLIWLRQGSRRENGKEQAQELRDHLCQATVPA